MEREGGREGERERERVVVVVKTTDNQRSGSLLEAFFCCYSREAPEAAVRTVKKQINMMMPMTRTLEYPFPNNHLQKILRNTNHFTTNLLQRQRGEGALSQED